MDDEGLIIDLSALTVADYVALSVAFDDDDRLTILAVLDKYSGGTLRNLPWPCWFVALDQATAQLQPVEDALSEVQAAAAFANIASKPIGATRE